MRKITFFPLTLLLMFFWGPIQATSERQTFLDNDSITSNGITMADNMLIGQLYTRANYLANGPMHDSFAILFAPGNSNDVTPNDAPKPMNFDENIARNHNGTYLSIERRAMPIDGEIYQLFSNNYRYTEYTLLLTVKAMQHMVFYLDDAYTGESFMLNTGIHPYNFTVDSNHPQSLSTSRFSLRATERAAFVLPYTNAFETQANFDEALALGFQFDRAEFHSNNGGFIRLHNGSLVTPKIDFSVYNALRLNFKISATQSGDGQQLSVSVSNDDGATYQVINVLDVPDDYTAFVEYIDLSSLNGTSGRIKLEMTDGTGAIRLRKFSLRKYGGFLYRDGNWSPSNPNGISTTRNIVVFNGNVTFNAPTKAHNVTVKQNGTLNVESVLNITGDLTNKGKLIFVSSATANGELGPVPAGSEIHGNFTVQRYTSTNRSYRMLSSAVTTTTSIHANWQEGASSNTDNPAPGYGTHITGATVDQQNGFDGTATGNPSMFTVNTESQQFEAISNTDVNTFEAGTSYLIFVRGDRGIDLGNNESNGEAVLRATGELKTGGQSQFFSTEDAGDFAMFGNPYQCAIDLNEVFSHSVNVNSNLYYVYDPTLATHGAYVTVNLPTGANTSNSDANQYLQPGQGAQFATIIDGPSAVMFMESAKAPGSFTATNATGNNLTANDMLTVQLYTSENYSLGGPVHDSFGIIFGDGLDNAITPVDAMKPMNMEENLGIDHNGKYLSLERREMPQPAEVFPLYSSGYKHLDYTLKMIVDGLENNLFYLDDRFAGTSTLLDAGETAYRFAVDANDPLSIATDRFSIRTEERLGVGENSFLSGVHLFPNPLSSNTFYIAAPKLNGETVSISVHDMLGREIYNGQQTFSGNNLKVNLSQDVKSGVYMATISYKGEKSSIRIIKR